MSNADLNPFVRNYGRAFEQPTYETSASYRQHWCRYCGCSGDIIHEQFCKLNPDNQKASDRELNNEILKRG